MRIDFHKWSAFKECPKKFYLRYIVKGPVTVPENDYFKLYGNLVQKFFERYCNQWRYRTPYIFPDVIRERLQVLYEDLLRVSIINWSDIYVKKSKEEIFEEAYGDVCAIMHSQSQNFFLNTESEVSIDVKVKDEHVINGRLDFLHHPPLSEDIIIIDGKGSLKIGKNVDVNQLLFYALLCSFHFHRLPKEIGFFYYRFNTYIPLPVNAEIINEFRARLSLDIKTMTAASEYLATPSAKSCKYCSYSIGCIECSKSKESRKRKSKIEVEGNGVVLFGF
jgi:CRISPR/Cas system-associated exonuclease Cas4 (RecB family)